MTPREATTAIILCGGRASRFGGVRKALLDMAGKPLIGHVIERLRGQVDGIVLACGASTAPYAAFQAADLTCIPDRDGGQGPLGGIVSALALAQTPWVLTTPADTPFIPPDLVAALTPACRSEGAAAVRAGGRRQNLSLLLDRERAASLAAFYDAGGRATHRWLDAHAVAEVELPAEDFANINSAEDLAAARRRLRGGRLALPENAE